MSEVDLYIAALPEDRRDALRRLRQTIREAAPEATEDLRYGMPHYELNGQLCAFASQKRYMSFYMFTAGELLRPLREQTGLDIGKGCVRFKRLDELPLDLVQDAVRAGAAASADREQEPT